MKDELPADLSVLQWHVDPTSKRYRTVGTAGRAARWLSGENAPDSHWLYRAGKPGPDGVRLERRYVGGGLEWWRSLPPAPDRT